jgi:uncharacterized protein YhaN
MKFNEIIVDAFGPFSDLRLNLRGGGNFHIIYGLNEAGKSSLLRSILALLFGIDAQTKDGFLHDYSALKVSAEVEAQNGQLLRFSRVKKKQKKDSLRDPDGKPIPESLLEPFLAHQSEAAFVALYGLDHEDLRRGGREMLEGKGDLGRALFESGGAGGLNRLLREYRESAEQLFAPRAQRPLNVALRAVDEGRRSIGKLLLRAGDYQLLQDQKNEAATKVARLRQESRQVAIDLDRLKRTRENRQDISVREALLGEISGLGTVPLLPADFTETRIRHTAAIESAQLAINRDTLERDARQAELDAIPTEVRTIPFEVAIAALVRGVDGHRSSLADLKKRQEAAQVSYLKAVGIWRQLFDNTDLAKVEEFRLAGKESTALRNLLRQHEVRSATQTKDSKRLTEAEKLLEKEQEELQNSDHPTDVSTLRTVLDSVKAEGPLEDNLRKVGEAQSQAGRVCEAALRALPGWKQSADELQRLQVPLSETIEKYAKLQADQQRRLGELDRELTRTSEEQASTREQIDNLSAGEVLPTLEALTAERELRDRGWRLIRRVAIEQDLTLADASQLYEPPTAICDAFETHTQGADGIADRLIEDSQQVARNQELHRTLGRLHDRFTQAQTEKERLETSIVNAASDWKALWPSLPFPVLSAIEMQGWLRKRDAVINALENAVRAAGDVDRAKQAVNEAIGRIVGALGGCGVQGKQEGETLASLLLRAFNFVHQQDQVSEELKRHQVTITALLSEIPQLRAAVQEHLDQGAQWEVTWQSATLRFPEAHRSIESVEGILQDLPEFFKHWDEHCNMVGRCDSIQGDIDRFRNQVAELCRKLSPELELSPADLAVETLETRLKNEKSNVLQREQLIRRISELEAGLALLRSQLQTASAEMSHLCKSAQVTEVGELTVIEKRVKDAAEINTKIHAIDETLIRRNGRALDEILIESKMESIEELDSRMEQLRSAQTALDQERDEAVKSLRDAEMSLQEQENRQAYESAVQTLQMSLSKATDLTEKYVRQRLAAAVLEKAMESYRERNQGQVVARAGAIFAALTNSQYSGLLAESEEGVANQLFVVRAKDGSRLDVSSLSDGSADQLFLALRMASIEQRAATSEPLPCIFDDILVNYDDVRTASALRELAELSGTTQVLLFTHHEKTIELAEKNCSAQYMLHRLGGQAVAQHA